MNPSFCFSKNLRLLNKDDFQNLKTESRFFVLGALLVYAKRTPRSETRIGIAVSKKLGNAVKRNKIKRKIRENFRRSNFTNEGIDLVLALNFKLINKNKLNFDQIVKEVDNSFNYFEKVFKGTIL